MARCRSSLKRLHDFVVSTHEVIVRPAQLRAVCGELMQVGVMAPLRRQPLEKDRFETIWAPASDPSATHLPSPSPALPVVARSVGVHRAVTCLILTSGTVSGARDISGRAARQQILISTECLGTGAIGVPGRSCGDITRSPASPLPEVIHVDAVGGRKADQPRQVVWQLCNHAEGHHGGDDMGHDEDRRAARRCR